MPSGTAPTTPNAGDLWFDGSNLYFRKSTGSINLTPSNIALLDATNSGYFQLDNIRLDANTISTQNTNGNLTLDPNGQGEIKMNKVTDFEDNNAYFTIRTLSGTSVALDWTKSNKQSITLSGNTTFSVTTSPAGACNLTLIIKQPAGANHSVTFPSSFKWPGGTAYTATATNGAVDIISIFFDGTSYFCADIKNFS
jgi:hypothetical protein